MAIASDFYRVLFQFHNLTKGRLQRYLIDFCSEKELIVLKITSLLQLFCHPKSIQD